MSDVVVFFFVVGVECRRKVLTVQSLERKLFGQRGFLLFHDGYHLQRPRELGARVHSLQRLPSKTDGRSRGLRRYEVSVCLTRSLYSDFLTLGLAP